MDRRWNEAVQNRLSRKAGIEHRDASIHLKLFQNRGEQQFGLGRLKSQYPAAFDIQRDHAGARTSAHHTLSALLKSLAPSALVIRKRASAEG
jgi:hypothetical protein